MHKDRENYTRKAHEATFYPAVDSLVVKPAKDKSIVPGGLYRVADVLNNRVLKLESTRDNAQYTVSSSLVIPPETTAPFTAFSLLKENTDGEAGLTFFAPTAAQEVGFLPGQAGGWDFLRTSRALDLDERKAIFKLHVQGESLGAAYGLPLYQYSLSLQDEATADPLSFLTLDTSALISVRGFAYKTLRLLRANGLTITFSPRKHGWAEYRGLALRGFDRTSELPMLLR